MSTTLSSSDYVYPTVLPWADIFSDLTGAGCSPYRVSTLIGESWSTVQRWVPGDIEPRDSRSRAILELHSRYCGVELTLQRLMEAVPEI